MSVSRVQAKAGHGGVIEAAFGDPVWQSDGGMCLVSF